MVDVLGTCFVFYVFPYIHFYMKISFAWLFINSFAEYSLLSEHPVLSASKGVL